MDLMAELTDYDWATDAKLSYLAAIMELRKRGLIEGRFEPINDKERKIVEDANG